MNKKEKGIVKQLRDLVANPPPQVRNLKWFWSLQDLMAKFDVEEEPKETLEEKMEREADEKYREEHGLDFDGKPIVYPGDEEPLEKLKDIELERAIEQEQHEDGDIPKKEGPE